MLDRTYQCVTAADRTVKQVKVLSAERLGGRCWYVRLSGTLSSAETRADTHLAAVSSYAFPRECFCKHFKNHFLFFFFLDKDTIAQTTAQTELEEFTPEPDRWTSSHFTLPFDSSASVWHTTVLLCDKCQICKETGRQLRFGDFLPFTEFSRDGYRNSVFNRSRG